VPSMRALMLHAFAWTSTQGTGGGDDVPEAVGGAEGATALTSDGLAAGKQAPRPNSPATMCLYPKPIGEG
jgi:hypothetical protein